MVGIKPPSPRKIWRFSSARFLQERNFRNKKSMVQYPRNYQRDRWTIEKEQNNKSLISQSSLYLKNKSNLFLWQVQSEVSC